MGAHELSALLWRERELLELLVFKLEEEQLILASGKSRWLSHATREVEQVMERVRQAGIARTVEATAVALDWGAPEDATLRDLADRAPDGPWGEILGAHLQALTQLTAEIQELRNTNEQLLRAGLRSTQETLAGVDTDSGTYDAHGAQKSSPSARLFDTTL